MRQLKMFSASQQRCLECGCQFVPFSRDLVAAWAIAFAREISLDFSTGWAEDRVYKQGLKYCDPVCADIAYTRAAVELLEREEYRAHKKNR